MCTHSYLDTVYNFPFYSNRETEDSLEVLHKGQRLQGVKEKFYGFFFSLWVNILLIVQKLHFVGLALQCNGHSQRFNPELFPEVSPLLYLLFHLETILEN